MKALTRRDLLKGAAAVGAAAAFGESATAGTSMEKTKFNARFAPHFGMFGSHAKTDQDQLKFAADQGFTAWEDNGMKGRSPADQEKIAKIMSDLGIMMGVFVVNPETAWNASLSTGNQDSLTKFLDECKSSVDVAKRVNAKWMTVVPGTVEPSLHPGYQIANVIDAMRQAAEIFEPHGLVMVMEPLNFRDHPSLFLTTVAQGYAICRAVNSPSCKILYDLYHMQIEDGNLIPNIDLAWKETAYFQIGDNPGRNEPLTGEINYKNVFAHLHNKGYSGILGMEHGKSQGGKEGELKLIQAYQSCDPGS